MKKAFTSTFRISGVYDFQKLDLYEQLLVCTLVISLMSFSSVGQITGAYSLGI